MVINGPGLFWLCRCTVLCSHTYGSGCMCLQICAKNVQSSRGPWFAAARNVLQSSVGGMSILDWCLSKMDTAFDWNHLSPSTRA